MFSEQKSLFHIFGWGRSVFNLFGDSWSINNAETRLRSYTASRYPTQHFRL